MSNEMQTKQPQRLTFSQYVNSPTGMRLIGNAIQNPQKQQAFVTAIISAVATNPDLQKCSPSSIISAALQGVSMGLAPSPQLGQFYMVPFENRKTGETRATFVPGYKGYIQMATNTGIYKKLNVVAIKEGELIRYDPLNEEIEVAQVETADRESMPTIGYYAMFEYTNGFRKIMYWSKEKMIAHADRYSPAFSRNATTGRYPKVSFADYEAGNYPKGDEWKYSSFWYKDFDGMAMKTMIRQILTKWGRMSIEMSNAIEQDTKNEAQGVDYGADLTTAALPEPTPIDGEPDAQPTQESGEPEVVTLDEL